MTRATSIAARPRPIAPLPHPSWFNQSADTRRQNNIRRDVQPEEFWSRLGL